MNTVLLGMLRAALVVLLVAEEGLAPTSAAAAAGGGCTATSVWPDGTTIERECIVEGEGKVKKEKAKPAGVTDEEMAWLKNTRWMWNDWREVIFKADGSFLAPAENCERDGNPKCQWSAAEDRIHVEFGGAGLHTLTATPDQQSISGARDSDGDAVHANRVG